MGDRTNVSFEIGGRLSRDLVTELLEAAASDGLGIDWERDLLNEDLVNHEGGSITLTGTDINYAACELLEAFCKGNGLFYLKLWDPGGGFEAGGELFDLTCRIDEGGPVRFASDGTGGALFLSDNEIRRLGSWEAVIARIDRLGGSLPPFVVVP